MGATKYQVFHQITSHYALYLSLHINPPRIASVFNETVFSHQLFRQIAFSVDNTYHYFYYQSLEAGIFVSECRCTTAIDMSV